ncbi:unnamed protein product [Caenorhabditis angaria]|uniref:SXP/RAL-2 family protein Ani s 5-like cation-binding domain-containing protein n=1 Tax=Caenorhabditis angaria TaxID=860376 RepID=A0A9P1INC0_9PELO|nr:unnamed protein product [Caenorhabditis angaria]
MRSNLLIFLFFLTNAVFSIDNIISPFERFNMEIEEFIPTIQQELIFADYPNMTDQQSQEQIRTLFPMLNLRIQELRNLGLEADKNRKEVQHKMCHSKHIFYYLKLEKQLKKLQKELVGFNITAEKSRKMLYDIYKAIKDWKKFSSRPC